MTLFVFYGILLITIGAFMSGSFSIPFDKVKQWKWETSWLVYCLFGYIVVPLAVCLLTVPDFISTLSQVPFRTVLWIFLLGALYGAANLTFGLSLRYLGLALGYALSLGLMMALGTLIPPAIDGRLAQLFEGYAGIRLILGIVISLIGIGISGYAGFLKSKQAGDNSGVNKEFNLKKGLAAALFVGVTGSSAALGIEQGNPIAKICVENGVNPLFQDSVVFLVLYSGSFVTTLVWCLYLSIKNKTIKDFIKVRNGSLGMNYLLCGLAGLLWFINYVFFGMGKSKMGESSFVAWGILMTMTIVCATLWGLYRKEWKGVSTNVYSLMWIGLIILVASSFLIGISVN
jgi:L-rhamnose-H+ transport protein